MGFGFRIHIDLVLPFCCCCRWENGGCLVHYSVTRCLVKGMSQYSQDATFVLIHVIKNDETDFGNEMSSVVKRESEYYIP